MTTPAHSPDSLRDRLKLGVEEEFQIVDRTTRALGRLPHRMPC
ncbi:hypothetical protein [Corynebacterium propinquum]